MKKVSYTQYSTWENCPWQWKLKYVDKLKTDDDSIHSIFGTAMHDVVQDWLKILYTQSEVMAGTIYLNDVFREKLITLFKESIKSDEDGQKIFLTDKQTLMDFYQQGCQIIEYIQKNHKKLFPTKNTVLFGIEYPVNIEIKPGIRYVGFIDIITHNTATDEYILYDLKTSTHGWSDYQKSNPVKTGQLLLYKRFFAEQAEIDINKISVEYVILKRIVSENTLFVIPRVSKFEPANKAPSLKKNWGRFERFLNTCFTNEGEYIVEQTATPNKDSCRFCEFKTQKDVCPFGM